MHAFFKLSGNARRIFTKLFEELVSHHFSYLITFQKVLWINFSESNQQFSESVNFIPLDYKIQQMRKTKF